MTIDKYELASVFAQLLEELPGQTSHYQELPGLKFRLLEYVAKKPESEKINEHTAELPHEEEVIESVEKNPDSYEEVDQTEELELLKILADAHSWLGIEPAPKFSKIGDTYPNNNAEIESYHVIRAALVRCGAYITKGMQ